MSRDPTRSEPEPDVTVLLVEPDAAGSRLDAFVARALGVGVREAARLCAEGRVLVDGRRAEKGRDLAEGARVEVRREARAWLVPVEAPWLSVAYVDDDVIVVDKPAGVPTHPLAPGEGGTAADAVAARFPEVAGASRDPREGGACHRLDTDTSGLLAFARSRAAWERLHGAFLEGGVGRAYLALVEGRLSGALEIDAPIAHHRSDKKRMVALDDERAPARGQPRPARSRVRSLVTGEGASLVLVEAEGGRRHQVRVHLAHAGHPLVGDALYGGRPVRARAGHLLHAARLALPGRPALVAPPPADFRAAARERGLSERAVADAVERLEAGPVSGR